MEKVQENDKKRLQLAKMGKHRYLKKKNKDGSTIKFYLGS